MAKINPRVLKIAKALVEYAVRTNQPNYQVTKQDTQLLNSIITSLKNLYNSNSAYKWQGLSLDQFLDEMFTDDVLYAAYLDLRKNAPRDVLLHKLLDAKEYQALQDNIKDIYEKAKEQVRRHIRSTIYNKLSSDIKDTIKDVLTQLVAPEPAAKPGTHDIVFKPHE